MNVCKYAIYKKEIELAFETNNSEFKFVNISKWDENYLNLSDV